MTLSPLSFCQFVLEGSLGDAVMTHYMSEPCQFPSLYSCQKSFLWANIEVDLAPHPVQSKLSFKTNGSCDHRPRRTLATANWLQRAVCVGTALISTGDGQSLPPLPPLCLCAHVSSVTAGRHLLSAAGGRHLATLLRLLGYCMQPLACANGPALVGVLRRHKLMPPLLRIHCIQGPFF